MQYLRGDVEATRAVWVDQGAFNRVSPDEEWQTEVSLKLFAAGRRGVRVDLEAQELLAAELKAEAAEHKAALVKHGLYRWIGKRNPYLAADMKALRARVQVAGGTKKTAKGSIATDSEYLLSLGDPVLAEYAAAKDVEKGLALAEALRPETGDIIRPRWNPLVSTGRISCSEPNLTQIPRKGGYRELIIARPGHVLLIADYNMLELRTLADVCVRVIGYSKLRDVIKLGDVPGNEDVHTQTGKWLGISRQAAKAINFGLPGGMGPRKLVAYLKQYGVEATEGQAREWREGWFHMYPEVRALHEYTNTLGTGDWPERYEVTLPWSGRKRTCFFTEACNHWFQGTGADVSKQAVLRLPERLAFLMLVHDELMAECPADYAEWGTQQLQKAMVEAGQLVCPNVGWPAPKVVTRWESK